jgi:tight adherence protein C
MNLDFLNTDLLLVMAGVAILIFGLIIVVFGFSTWLKRGSRITNRLDQYVGREEEAPAKPKRKILLRETSGSLLSRTVGNWIKSLMGFISKFAPEKARDRLEHQLGVAGYPGGMHVGQFSALRFILLAVGFFVAFLILRDLSNLSLTRGAMAVLVILLGYMLPTSWLSSKMRARQSEIQRGLPDALDMLSVCASAGMAFDQSLQKITDYWDTDLGREFKRTIHEMEMGVSRGTALVNMSNRLDVDDLTNFITIIVQAEKMGMSYADVLHSQALQMRIMRQYRAKEIANKLPAKMIIPLALFIFPAIVIVILAPAIPRLLSIF